MSRHRVAIEIVPRRGLLDPQGKTVAEALRTLGFEGVREVHVGRYMTVELEATDGVAAERDVREMCARLLANPVTEDFKIVRVTPVEQP